MSKKLICPHCKKDVSLTDHEVFLDGDDLQSGGCRTVAWEENCPDCGEPFFINVILGPVDVSVSEVMEGCPNA